MLDVKMQRPCEDYRFHVPSGRDELIGAERVFGPGDVLLDDRAFVEIVDPTTAWGLPRDARSGRAEPCLTDAAPYAAPSRVVVRCRYAEARTNAAAVSAARWSGGITGHLLSGSVVTLRV
jgi:hypothetical protein